MAKNAIKTVKKAFKTVLKKRPDIKVARRKTKTTLKSHAKTTYPKLSLKKPHHNPIIAPRRDNIWDGCHTFNPGVVQLDDKVHFMYRAIGPDGVSRLGYAQSNDGYTIDLRNTNPAYEHSTKQRSFNTYSYFSGGSWGGGEDPRLVRVGNESLLYMTYTACNGDLRVALTSINVDDFQNQRWNWSPPVYLSPPGEVHKNWLIFPEKINGKYAILHGINPDIMVEYRDHLEFDDANYIKSFWGGGKPRKNCWDKWLRGAGPVPLKTKYGWLLFYHAMDNDWGKYRVGAMLLDYNDPTKIIARAKAPILEPKEHYENHGFKGGVVYASGAVVKDDNLYIYYGGADSYVCVAYANYDTFLNELKKHQEPKLKTSVVRK